VAIEVTREAVVSAGLAGAGLPVVVVNPTPQWLFDKDRVDRDVEDPHKIPCDREGTFDPKLIQRYQSRFPG
jgi:hypothetical protein